VQLAELYAGPPGSGRPRAGKRHSGGEDHRDADARNRELPGMADRAAEGAAAGPRRLISSRIGRLADRLVLTRPDRRQVDLERDPRRLKPDLDVLVVAERHVVGVPAAAQRRSRERLHRAVVTPDLDRP